MDKLSALRQLAAQMRYLNPSQLSKPQAGEFKTIARKIYTPQFLEAKKLEEKWLEQAAKASSEEQRAKYLAAARSAEYDAARYSKLDQAASNIANARTIYDDDLRALLVPGSEQGVPGGFATFYPPGHYAGDPVLDNAAYLELLGTAPDAPGAGRVLLRGTGMSSPSNPLMWHSTSYPDTIKFYESRGGERIPKGEVPRSSDLFSESLPMFRVPRGDMIKEKHGGLVRYKESRV